MPICSSGTRCPLYSAASLGKHVIGEHANPPSHIILTPGRPVIFRGPSFIVSNMQEETTPIFKCLWYDWTQYQPGIEPTNPLGQCWVPPIVAFYDQQGLLRTYLSPGFVCLFVCGISLTSGQLVSELFPDCTRSCFSQVFLRRRDGDRIYEMRCLFVAVGPNARFILVLPHWDNMS